MYVLGLDRSLDADARVERLVFDHQAKLARYVRRFIPQTDVALDVVQDVFLSAYKMLRADPTRPLSAGWLYKTATNYAITHLRKAKRRGETLPLDAAAAFRSEERSESSLDLQAALEALGHEQLQCVMLTAYAGYSSGEAGLILGISADAVRQRTCRAMRALRKSLSDDRTEAAKRRPGAHSEAVPERNAGCNSIEESA
ncbi:MAG: sigma-70 family RNA polymerase sigma factor [Candidatus Eremiobacteraeota bacterium]|nr:sigma-70 family RNA polymerase sigma factor [Candidatus Eremiobacteraeota bacterium]